MAETFYTILTQTGQAKIANAHVLGTSVNLTQIAVGDGSGSYYNPVETQTALVHEVWRGSISSISIDDVNLNWLIVEAVIPTTQGGFMVREVGVFDDAGDLIAIGKYPETYKPLAAEGSAKDLYIRMILEVTNADSVTLKIDPAIVLATKSDVNNLAGTGRTTETVRGNADAITAHTGNTTTAHGATSAATADKIIIRDAAGRAKVAAPSAADDIARKDTVDAVQTGLVAHLADGVQHKIVDTVNGSKYVWGIENGQLFLQEVG